MENEQIIFILVALWQGFSLAFFITLVGIRSGVNPGILQTRGWQPLSMSTRIAMFIFAAVGCLGAASFSGMPNRYVQSIAIAGLLGIPPGVWFAIRLVK